MLTLKDLPIGSVAIAYDGKFAVVVDHKPSNPKNSVIFKLAAKHTTYKGSPADFKAVVGTAEVSKLNGFVGEAPPPRPQSNGVDHDFLLPAELKGLKIGDSIIVKHGGREKEVIFQGYKRNRPKYPLSYQIATGGNYKAPVSSFIRKAGEPKAKRSEGEIQGDILDVYSQLSPENLTGDGEHPGWLVSRKRKKLEAKLQTLFTELGRELSEDDALNLTLGKAS